MKVLMPHFEGISLVLTEAEIQYLILHFHITEKQTNLFFLVCSGKSRCLMKFPYGGRSCLRATYEMPKIFVLSCFANQTFILLEQNIFSQITKWY